MRRAYLPVLCFLLVLIGLGSTAHAEKRVALVIGNSAYEHTIQLKNPKNDARDIAITLKRLGFEVTTGLDLTEEKFLDTVSSFFDKLLNADVALFFYAGHGVQYQNVNYLIPVNAALRNEFRLKRETIALGDIIEQMEGRVPLNLVFLDACRNNPLADKLKRSIRGKGRAAHVGRGLARIEGGGRDTLITFAAAPGAVAADGVGRNSPFTSALLKHMETPGVEIEVMLKRVTGDVRRTTSDRQEPERLSRLTTEFYFKAKEEAEPAARPLAAPARTSVSPAAQAWAATKDTTSIAVLEVFISRFSGTVYGDMAAARRDELKSRIAALTKEKAPPAKRTARTVRFGKRGQIYRFGQWNMLMERIHANEKFTFIYFWTQDRRKGIELNTGSGSWWRMWDGDNITTLFSGKDAGPGEKTLQGDVFKLLKGSTLDVTGKSGEFSFVNKGYKNTYTVRLMGDKLEVWLPDKGKLRLSANSRMFTYHTPGGKQSFSY